MHTQHIASPSNGSGSPTAGVDVSPSGSPEASALKAKADITTTTTLTIELAIEKIIADDTVRTRATVNEDTVTECAEQMGIGATFPPVTVFSDGKSYWLADGFHRVGAAKSRGDEVINADVRKGTRLDAITFGFKANDRHGLRRTNADKRYAVALALREFGELSDRAIAEICGVGHQLVADVRQLDDSSSSSRTGRDGKRRQVRAKTKKASLAQKSVSASKPAAPLPGEGAQGDHDIPLHLPDGAEALVSPAQEQSTAAQTPESVDRRLELQTVAAADRSAPLGGDEAVELAAGRLASEVTTPVASEHADFALADGTTRRVPWNHTRALPIEKVEAVLLKAKRDNEDLGKSYHYDQPTLVKFQNLIISTAAFVAPLFDRNPTAQYLKMVSDALTEVRDCIPEK